MAQRNALPILVVAKSENDAEKINGALRSAGHAVHSRWAGDLETVEAGLKDEQPDLIVCFTGLKPAPLDQVASLRDAAAADIPIIAIGSIKDKDAAAAMEAGARDVVPLSDSRHLHAVVERELAYLRLKREYRVSHDALEEAEKRLKDVITESGDAIAYIHEGIHVSANPAYLALFGFGSAEDIEGIPVMDLFDAKSQGAVKDAVRATLKGKAPPEPVSAKGKHTGGKTFDIDFELAAVEYEGDPCVEIAIRGTGGVSRGAEGQLASLQQQLKEQQDALGSSSGTDPISGLPHRQRFIELLDQTISTPPKGAVRALLYLRPDAFSAVTEKVGPAHSEQVILELKQMIQETLREEDLLGRFGGTVFTILMTRPKLKEILDWADKLRAAIAARIFEAGGQSITLTASVGYIEVDDPGEPAAAWLTYAMEANRAARSAGGNRVNGYQPPKAGEGAQSDAIWAKRIKDALRKDLFLLAYQPISSLQGDPNEYVDILVRMLDEDDNEIQPQDFMPAAERAGLVVGIDRWVLERGIQVLQERSSDRRRTHFFVRLSEASLMDNTLIGWLEKVLEQAGKLPEGGLIFQVAEMTAERHLREIREFVQLARKWKCGFAIEHFGIGLNPGQLLDHVKTDFVKIDGSFMSDLTSEQGQRGEVQRLIEKAKSLGVETVAERVENADTMAVLWQMGVSYIQGNYVQEPEVVIADPRLPTD